LAPIPHLIVKRSGDGYGSSSGALKEVSAFFTTGLVLSAFALALVLERTAVISMGSCALVFASNIVMFLTIWGFFWAFDNEDGFEYNTW